MSTRSLAPEQHIELQIALDRLRDQEDRCRDGLRQLVAGRLSREDYLILLTGQIEAHEAWAANHRRYFGSAFDQAV